MKFCGFSTFGESIPYIYRLCLLGDPMIQTNSWCTPQTIDLKSHGTLNQNHYQNKQWEHNNHRQTCAIFRVFFMIKRSWWKALLPEFLRGTYIRLSLLSSAMLHTKIYFYILSCWLSMAMKRDWFGSPEVPTAHGTKGTSKWCQKG